MTYMLLKAYTITGMYLLPILPVLLWLIIRELSHLWEPKK